MFDFYEIQYNLIRELIGEKESNLTLDSEFMSIFKSSKKKPTSKNQNTLRNEKEDLQPPKVIKMQEFFAQNFGLKILTKLSDD